MLVTMMSTSLRLQGDMRGLVMGLRQFTMSSATTSGSINMNFAIIPSINLACSSNRQFSAAAPPPIIELPKRPNTPWVNFFKATLPEYRKKHPGAKVWFELLFQKHLSTLELPRSAT